MARRIELKTATLKHNFNGSAGPGPPTFTWAEMLEAILYIPPREQGGFQFDELVKCVKASEAVDKAVADGADHVTFSEEAYQTLKAKLEAYKFAFADPAFVEFGLAIREAKEIT